MDVSFQHNTYYSENGTYTYRWGEAAYTTLEAFREGTGQETMNGSPTGIAADPVLLAPGTTGIIGYPLDLQKLQDRYSLQKKSPLIGQGIAVALPTPFSPAMQDIIGNKLKLNDQPDMGAMAYTPSKRFRWLRTLF
jgi:hypothetical protein